MLTAEKCRDRAAECQKMAERAPNARMRDILLDMGRTWTRLALEAEQWTPDESTVGAAHKGCSEKCCTKGANAADATSTSRFEARANLG